MAELSAGADPMQVLARAQRNISVRKKAEHVSAMVAAKDERQRQREQRLQQDLQRAWLRTLWVALAAVTTKVALPSARREWEAARCIQRAWRKRARVLLLRRIVQMAAAARSALWIVKVHFRTKRRAMCADKARVFMRDFVCGPIKFRVSMGAFRCRVTAAQGLAREWLACQAARRTALEKLWHRIGKPEIATIMHERKFRRASGSGVKQGGDLAAKYAEFDQALKRANSDLDARTRGEAERRRRPSMPGTLTTTLASDERCAKRRLDDRLRKSVLFGDNNERDQLMSATLARVRKEHIARHADAFNFQKRLTQAEVVAEIKTVDDLRNSLLQPGPLQVSTQAAPKPRWPPMIIFSTLAKDIQFAREVKKAVAFALDKPATDDTADTATADGGGADGRNKPASALSRPPAAAAGTTDAADPACPEAGADAEAAPPAGGGVDGCAAAYTSARGKGPTVVDANTAGGLARVPGAAAAAAAASRASRRNRIVARVVPIGTRSMMNLPPRPIRPRQ
eukprot:g2156.t1